MIFLVLCLSLSGFCNSELVLSKNDRQFLIHISEANQIIPEEQIDFFRTFIQKGDLVFDVGANMGVKTEIFLACGAGHVICFEPQPICLQALNQGFGRNIRVAIEPFALGMKEERLEMFIHSPGSGICTLSKEYTLHSRFADRGFQWNQKIPVDVTTLDLMIQKYGLPKFCKIDVENFELEVLQGMTTPIPFLSFECNTDQLKTTLQCLEYLETLGYNEFNYAIAERGYFISPQWMNATDLVNKLHSLMEEYDFSPIWGLYGDVYAKHAIWPPKEEPSNRPPLLERYSPAL